jgi:hypothetical protein
MTDKSFTDCVAPETADCQRFVAAAVATALMKGLSLDEIRNLYAILQLITQNVYSEIQFRSLFPALYPTPPSITPPYAR